MGKAARPEERLPWTGERSAQRPKRASHRPCALLSEFIAAGISMLQPVALGPSGAQRNPRRSAMLKSPMTTGTGHLTREDQASWKPLACWAGLLPRHPAQDRMISDFCKLPWADAVTEEEL